MGRGIPCPNTYRKEDFQMKTTVKEKAPAITGKAAKRLLYLMAQDLTDNEALYVFTLANKLFFNGNWNTDSASCREFQIEAILSELENTEDEALLDLIRQLLTKSNKKAALHAANTKNGLEHSTDEI